MRWIYLHGFASSPASTKAVYVRDRMAALQVPLEVPNLNQDDFSHLTITRQIAQIEAMLPEPKESVTLIGSSLGGLTSAWLGQCHLQVQRLILLAPAFGFLNHWLLTLTPEQCQQWQTQGYLPIYHYGEGRSLPLHYQFVEDARQYHQSEQLTRPIPTLILHGQHDETIPIQTSRDYAEERPWVQLQELDSDHTLGNVMPRLWQAIREFCQL